MFYFGYFILHEYNLHVFKLSDLDSYFKYNAILLIFKIIIGNTTYAFKLKVKLLSTQIM